MNEVKKEEESIKELTLEEINRKYNDDTFPIFPFIPTTRVTVLREGLYRKHNAKFRGVTAVFDPLEKEYKFPLYGMYYIPENIVIVPPEMVMTPARESLIKRYVKQGFKKVDAPPKFLTIYFDPDSQEAKIALKNKLDYQARQALLSGSGDISNTTVVQPKVDENIVDLFE